MWSFQHHYCPEFTVYIRVYSEVYILRILTNVWWHVSTIRGSYRVFSLSSNPLCSGYSSLCGLPFKNHLLKSPNFHLVQPVLSVKNWGTPRNQLGRSWTTQLKLSDQRSPSLFTIVSTSLSYLLQQKTEAIRPTGPWFQLELQGNWVNAKLPTDSSEEKSPPLFHNPEAPSA